MIECETSIEIAKPQAAVFALIDDDSKAPQWMGMCHSMEALSPPPKRVGTSMRYSYKEGSRVKTMDGAVTVYDRPRRLEMELTDKLFKLVVVFSLESAGSGTRLDYDMSITPTSFMAKLMGPMIRSSTQKQIAKDVAKLKSILESA